jgi:hypothetical protein
MSVLKHVGVMSVAKITALLGLVSGIFYGILLSVLATTYIGMMAGFQNLGQAGAGSFGAGLLILATIGGVTGGFIYGAVIAFLYNAFAGWVGGIELDLA